MITYSIKIVYAGGNIEATRIEVWVVKEGHPEHYLAEAEGVAQATAYINGHREGVIGV